VRSATERIAGLTALLVFAAACTNPDPSVVATDRPSATPIESPSAEPSARAEPGRPYDAARILDAMRSSPRPDGVATQLQTETIAAALADAIWTFDGTEWDTLVIEGTCAATCTVEVAGSRAGTAGEDLWVFSVDPEGGDVTVETASLSAVPHEVAVTLDDLARRVATPSALDEMRVTNVAWLPPPDGDRFVLSYRSGGEEGSCAAEVTVDAGAGELVDEQYTNC